MVKTGEQSLKPGERLIQEGLFRIDGEGRPWLIGSRCDGCGAVFASRRRVCLACFGRGMNEHLLEPEGTVHSFTTVHQAGGGVVLKVPYIIAQVALPDDIIATAPLVDCDPEAVVIGAPVRARTLRFTEPDGEVIVSWAFAPISNEEKGSSS